MAYIKALEHALEKKAIIEMLPLQPGDVPDTYADITDLEEIHSYRPKTNVREGIEAFVKWYKDFY